MSELVDIYSPRHSIGPATRIATAGSCFAQHIARALTQNGYTVVDAEPKPDGLSDSSARRYGYLTYSARYGNIYHVRQLRQLLEETFKSREPSNFVWSRGGRYYDALRPSVEPEGLRSEEMVYTHRSRHIAKVKELFGACDLLVYTFGLTEAWVHRESGTVYPTAPGTIAGDFDPSIYDFVNFSHAELLADFIEIREILQGINPNMRFIVTVSPVGLAATATERHVMVANSYSKATLRSVAGELFDRFEDVDYFPSYEIVTGVAAGNTLFDETNRDVTPDGVKQVMKFFFQAYGRLDAAHTDGHAATPIVDPEEIICEDVLLEAFGL